MACRKAQFVCFPVFTMGSLSGGCLRDLECPGCFRGVWTFHEVSRVQGFGHCAWLAKCDVRFRDFSKIFDQIWSRKSEV